MLETSWKGCLQHLQTTGLCGLHDYDLALRAMKVRYSLAGDVRSSLYKHLHMHSCHSQKPVMLGFDRVTVSPFKKCTNDVVAVIKKKNDEQRIHSGR